MRRASQQQHAGLKDGLWPHTRPLRSPHMCVHTTPEAQQHPARQNAPHPANLPAQRTTLGPLKSRCTMGGECACSASMPLAASSACTCRLHNGGCTMRNHCCKHCTGHGHAQAPALNSKRAARSHAPGRQPPAFPSTCHLQAPAPGQLLRQLWVLTRRLQHVGQRASGAVLCRERGEKVGMEVGKTAATRRRAAAAPCHVDIGHINVCFAAHQ